MNKFSKLPPKTAEEFMDQAAVAVTEPKPKKATPAKPKKAAIAKQAAQGKKAASAVPDPDPDDESIYRTLTLRLNRTRYKKLKMMATVTETPIQHLLTKALDNFLATKH